MTLQEKIIKRYKPGQIVNMCRRNDDEKIMSRFKVKILRLYPFFILTEHNGFRECFTYFDFDKLTAIKKGEAD